MFDNFVFRSVFSLSAMLFLTVFNEALTSECSTKFSSGDILGEENQVTTNFTVERLFKEGALTTESKHAIFLETVSGLKAKKIGNNNVAKMHFYKASRFVNLRGMIELAGVYYDEGFLKESMRWAILAFQMGDLLKENNSQEMQDFLKKN